MNLLLLLPVISTASVYAPIPSLPAAPFPYGTILNRTTIPLPETVSWAQVLPQQATNIPLSAPTGPPRATSIVTASPPPPQSFEHFLSNIDNLGDDWSIIGPPGFDGLNTTNFEPSNQNLANALLGGEVIPGDTIGASDKSEEFVAKLSEMTANTTALPEETLQRTPEINEEEEE